MIRFIYAVLIGSVLGGIIYILVSNVMGIDDECTKLGGIQVRTYGGLVCIRAEVLKK